jgi:hypothetical protein
LRSNVSRNTDDAGLGFRQPFIDFRFQFHDLIFKTLEDLDLLHGIPLRLVTTCMFYPLPPFPETATVQYPQFLQLAGTNQL